MLERKNITGIVLAGGRSTRMGRDKGFVEYNGKPFIAHIIESLKPLVNEIVIVSDNEDYERFGHYRVNDHFKDMGPLAGLYSGLYHSKTEVNLVLSCDVPLVNEALLLKLIQEVTEQDDVVQIKSQGKTNPLIAIYKKRCMATCLSTLESGERRLHRCIDQLNSRNITVDQSLERFTKNINTSNDLYQLQKNNN